MGDKISNSQIAKNTLFLYMRMIVSIMVNLYTVRVLWKILGVDDYGIYNVVGGIVLMFAFLNNAMVASSQRFISFELGKGDKQRLQKTFSVSIAVHMALAVIIVILAETVGIWFLNSKLNIPENRMIAANCVYQCSVISFVFTIISVPYNACIVAHEHMRVYGYFGILDVVLKLVIVLVIATLPFDKLISYAVLILVVSACMRLIYGFYCRHNFEECRFKRIYDRHLMKEMFSFAGWSFIGNMGFSVRDQGINIILNIFFNVAVNAAKGIANQVGGVINGFASNFTMAVNPQITKRYAAGDINMMLRLLFNGCKYALLLMSIVVIPLIISAETILRLWLGEVAPYTVGFLQLVLLMSLIDCVVSPITTSLQAIGKIKKFQIIISIIMVSNIPVAWLWLLFAANPFVVMFVCMLMSVMALIARLMLLHEQIPFSYIRFLKTVYAKTLPFFVVASIIVWFLYQIISKNLFGMTVYGLSSVVLIVGMMFVLVLNRKERGIVLKQIKKIFKSDKFIR